MYDITNFNSAIYAIYMQAFLAGVIFTVIPFIINWRIRYQITSTPRDILYRRLVFFAAALVLLLCSVFLFTPYIMELKLNMIGDDYEVVSLSIESKKMLYWIFPVLAYFLVYSGVAYLLKAYFKKHKHFIVFYSNNKLFGIF